MAYGARLESELGESPQGFKSPILRAKKDPRLSGVFSLPGSRDLRRRGFASTESPILRHKKEHPFGCSFLDLDLGSASRVALTCEPPQGRKAARISGL